MRFFWWLCFCRFFFAHGVSSQRKVPDVQLRWSFGGTLLRPGEPPVTGIHPMQPRLGHHGVGTRLMPKDIHTIQKIISYNLFKYQYTHILFT